MHPDVFWFLQKPNQSLTFNLCELLQAGHDHRTIPTLLAQHPLETNVMKLQSVTGLQNMCVTNVEHKSTPSSTN